MSDAPKLSLKQKFEKLPASTRTAIVGGSVVFVLLALGTVFIEDGKGPKQEKKPTQQDNLTVYNPGNNSATEGVVAEVQDGNKRAAEQKQRIELLEAQLKQTQVDQKGSDGNWSEISNLVSQVQALQERVNSMQQQGNASTPSVPVPTEKKGFLDGVLPDAVNALKNSMGGSAPTGQPVPANTTAPDMQPPPSLGGASSTPFSAPVISIQVVGEVKKPVEQQVVKKEVPSAYIPSGSNFEAVLLNGMDASTSISANRNPTPALLRIKTEAILPNFMNFNVKECFVMVGGFGNISTERVEMRTESMSCISETGEVFEGKMEGYLVGEDGKAGARGRVVSKQGALLAKSFMAGFVGGIGNAFAPQPVQSLNITGAAQSYQLPDADQVIGAGLANGLNKSSTALASFYIKLAEQMFPIVELDAGRKMTVILLKGVDLKPEKRP